MSELILRLQAARTATLQAAVATLSVGGGAAIGIAGYMNAAPVDDAMLIAVVSGALLWFPVKGAAILLALPFTTVFEQVTLRWIQRATADDLTPALVIACHEGWANEVGTSSARARNIHRAAARFALHDPQLSQAVRDRLKELEVGPWRLRRMISWSEVPRPMSFVLRQESILEPGKPYTRLLNLMSEEPLTSGGRVDPELVTCVIDVIEGEDEETLGQLYARIANLGRSDLSEMRRNTAGLLRATRGLEGRALETFNRILVTLPVGVADAAAVAEALGRMDERTLDVAAGVLKRGWHGTPKELIDAAGRLAA